MRGGRTDRLLIENARGIFGNPADFWNEERQVAEELLLGDMATRFVDIDRDTALLLPPDLRDWVPANHLVHFLIDAVEKLDLGQIKVNTRGTGDAHYPPAMLLGLLV